MSNKYKNFNAYNFNMIFCFCINIFRANYMSTICMFQNTKEHFYL